MRLREIDTNLAELIKKNDSLAVSRQLVGLQYGSRDEINTLEYRTSRRLSQDIFPSESVDVKKYCVNESLKQRSTI